MRKAAIDVGTNSVRLLITDPVETDLRITRLGENLDKTGVISEEAAKRTVAAVHEFAARARNIPTIIFGTAALREAKNGPDVAQRIGNVRILSGEEEARITWIGATHGIDTTSAMVLDIGGGSTEFITADTSVSMRLGSVRQTERGSSVEEIRALVLEGIAGRRVERLIGVAGSVTQLAALELELDKYDPTKTHGFTLSLDRINHWINIFLYTPNSQLRTLKGMVPERAETILAGSIILRETIVALGASGVIVSEYDSLQGAIEIYA